MKSAWRRLGCVILLACGAVSLPGQIRLNRISVGMMAVHDHVHIDFHGPVLHDPYPHEFQQGYAYDGVDLIASAYWSWGRYRQITRLRISPGTHSHFAYDQDTDFMPNNRFTHGDAGITTNRTFALSQWDEFQSLGRWGELGMTAGFSRQAAQYHQVLTYDLNSNPALPSREYYRPSPERAILYELRGGFGWRGGPRHRHWALRAHFNLTPLDQVLLHNYVPELAATSTLAYGFGGGLDYRVRLGDWLLTTGGDATGFNSYGPTHSFNRQIYSLHVTLAH